VDLCKAESDVRSSAVEQRTTLSFYVSLVLFTTNTIFASMCKLCIKVGLLRLNLSEGIRNTDQVETGSGSFFCIPQRCSVSLDFRYNGSVCKLRPIPQSLSPHSLLCSRRTQPLHPDSLLSVIISLFQARPQTWSKPLPSYPHVDPLFGVDAFLLSLKALGQGRLMDDIDDRFKTLNEGVNTFSIFLRIKCYLYNGPRKCQNDLATNFDRYGIPKTRKIALGILGRGFSPLLAITERLHERPNIVRSQVGNMPNLEKHVARVIGKIPKNGQVVDMNELFSDFTMGSTTELLFCESTHILLGNPNPKVVRFTQAFNYVSEGLSVRIGIRTLATLVPDRKFHEVVKYLKEFVDIYVSRVMDWPKRREKERCTDEFAKEGRYVFFPELVKSGYDKSRIAAELMNSLTARRRSIRSLLTVF
jgi:hypothetical protein